MLCVTFATLAEKDSQQQQEKKCFQRDYLRQHVGGLRSRERERRKADDDSEEKADKNNPEGEREEKMQKKLKCIKDKTSAGDAETNQLRTKSRVKRVECEHKK